MQWLKKQERDLSDNDAVASVDEVQGMVRVWTGMWFDARSRQISERTEIHRGEMLFLTKDSKATVHWESGSPIQLGPQDEDAVVIMHDDWHWFLTPHSGLKVQADRFEPGGQLDIGTPWDSRVTVRGRAAFQLNSNGKLQVFEGEVEVFQNADEKSTVVKVGQEFAHATPEAPGKTDPDFDRAIEKYLQTTKKLNALLEGVTDEASAQKVASEATDVVNQWVAQDTVLSDLKDLDAGPSMTKYGPALKKHMGALQSNWERLRQFPEMTKSMAEALEKVDRIIGGGPPATVPDSQSHPAERPIRLERE